MSELLLLIRGAMVVFLPYVLVANMRTVLHAAVSEGMSDDASVGL